MRQLTTAFPTKVSFEVYPLMEMNYSKDPETGKNSAEVSGPFSPMFVLKEIAKILGDKPGDLVLGRIKFDQREVLNWMEGKSWTYCDCLVIFNMKNWSMTIALDMGSEFMPIYLRFHDESTGLLTPIYENSHYEFGYKPTITDYDEIAQYIYDNKEQTIKPKIKNGPEETSRPDVQEHAG